MRMMKSWKLQIMMGIALAVFIATGCKAANTGEAPVPTTPDVEDPINPYTAEDYAKALRTASLKLRGELPPVSQTTQILDAKEPRLEYEALIDQYMDPAQNPLLGESLRQHFREAFLMGGKTENVNHLGVNHTVNFDEVPNLATYLILNDLPWSEILTAEYCVDNNFQQIACDTNSPVLAGVLTHPAFLRTYGKACALNYQRISAVHQLFECNIYPDAQGSNYLARSNTGANEPENVPAAQDPGSDTGSPPRIHKKYQGFMAGSGQTCYTCHKNNFDRQIFAKYVTDDVNFANVASGFFEPTWTMLEIDSPHQNAGKCYDIPQGFTYAGAGVPDGGGSQVYDCDQYAALDDILNSNAGCCFDELTTDPFAEDTLTCMDPASEWCMTDYKGVKITNPDEYADALLDPSLNDDSFAKCQTRRLYTWVIGADQGEIGLQAANGRLPYNPGNGVIEKYRSSFEHSGWNAREVLTSMFKGDEFLSTQVQ